MAISERKLQKLIAEVKSQSEEFERLEKKMNFNIDTKSLFLPDFCKKSSNEDKNNPLATYRITELEERIKNLPLGIMFVGPTGVGKSSTINALLGQKSAVVGYGVNPETMDAKSYKFNKYIKFWDTPGLGDSPEQDKKHIKKILTLLHKQYKKNDVSLGRQIDLVVVIIDGSHRDIGTVFSFVKDYIIPEINNENILFVINQADMAMKGRHFDERTGKPDEILNNYLMEQAESMKQRIKESTGLTITAPVIYSATNNFNLTGIFDYIIDNQKWKMRKFTHPYEYLESKYFIEDSHSTTRTKDISTGQSDSSDFGEVVSDILGAPIRLLGDIFYSLF